MSLYDFFLLGVLVTGLVCIHFSPSVDCFDQLQNRTFQVVVCFIRYPSLSKTLGQSHIKWSIYLIMSYLQSLKWTFKLLLKSC